MRHRLHRAVPFAAAVGVLIAAAGQASAQNTVDTTITVTVTAGILSISGPTSATLPSAAPGTRSATTLSAFTVTDARALVNSAWTATVAMLTPFTSGSQTIPNSDVVYASGPAVGTPTGTGFTPGQATATAADAVNLSTARTAFSHVGVGANAVSWAPYVGVDIPATAVAGTYTGVMEHSVA